MTQTRSPSNVMRLFIDRVNELGVRKPNANEIVDIQKSLIDFITIVLEHLNAVKGKPADPDEMSVYIESLLRQIPLDSLKLLREGMIKLDRIFSDKSVEAYRLGQMLSVVQVSIDSQLVESLVEDIQKLKHAKTIFSSSVTTDSEKQMIERLYQLYKKDQLDLKAVIKNYLEGYLQNRSKSYGHTRIGPVVERLKAYFFEAYPEIKAEVSPSLMDGIKDTEENRILAWIGRRYTRNDCRLIQEEAIALLQKHFKTGEQAVNMTSYWSEPQLAEDKLRLFNSFKLLERLGPQGFSIVSQIFHGEQVTNKKVSEDLIAEVLNNKDKWTSLQKNVETLFPRVENRQEL